MLQKKCKLLGKQSQRHCDCTPMSYNKYKKKDKIKKTIKNNPDGCWCSV